MILLFGGTRFLGRHIVESLAAHGLDSTCFHRGSTRCTLPPGVREIYGDRNDPFPPELDTPWDAIVDVSGQLPEQIERSRALVTGRYVFISTLSVYADLSQPGTAEGAPTHTTVDDADPAAAYGGRKFACEKLVRERYGERATVLRPGIIAGIWDYTERFTYWPRRALAGGTFDVPAPPELPLQFVDARDVAEFAVHAIEREIGGAYNVTGPAHPYSLGALATTCAAAAAERGIRAEPVFVPRAVLLERGVEPWSDLPLWIDDPAFAGMFQSSNASALAAGLTLRPPIETIRALMDWIVAEQTTG